MVFQEQEGRILHRIEITIIVSVSIHYDRRQKTLVFIWQVAFLYFVIRNNACVCAQDKMENTLPISEYFARSFDSKVIFDQSVGFIIIKSMGVFFPGGYIEMKAGWLKRFTLDLLEQRDASKVKLIFENYQMNFSKINDILIWVLLQTKLFYKLSYSLKLTFVIIRLQLIIYKKMMKKEIVPKIQPPKVDLLNEQKVIFDRIFNKKNNSWKILIYDQPNNDVISTLFKVKDLKENNVALYFNINQYRQQIQGVTVIYLVKPTTENIQLIVQDFQRDLYSSVIFHFTSEPPAHLISNLAKSLSQIKSAVTKVQKVQFSNVGFQCIDRKMCILPENVELINLLSILKNQPIFVHSSADQDQVTLLKQKLIESEFINKLNQEGNKIPKQGKKFTKVLIFNRENDYFPIFSHGITYASLMEDVWKFNRTGTKLLDKKEQIDLNDQIWLDKKNYLTSEMELESELNRIKNKLTGLNNKIQQFSELTEKQHKIQWHLNSAAEIISQAKQRRLNEFHAIEEDLYIKKMLSGQNKAEFMELLNSATNPDDKTRLILTYLICAQNYDQNQVQELQNIFLSIKNNNFYNELKAKRIKNEGQESPNNKYIKKFAKGIWKNLMNQEKKYLVVKYLQKIKDLSQKNLKQLGLMVTPLKELPVNPKVEHTIVYCSGGVCFNQYANLSQFHPSVIYCGDKFINYREFL